MYDYYLGKAYDQVTTSSPLRAKRGNIYDANMNLLAASNTVWRIFVSTKELRLAESKSGTDHSAFIAKGLSDILSVSEELLYNKMKKSKVLDVTLKSSVNAEVYEKILYFIDQNSLEKLLFTEAKTSRYYPEGKMLAHVLGFTGSDNQGLYGLEYYYDSQLSGTDGYYLYAKDATGKELNTEYSSYVAASDGNSLITTVDSYIQKELEAIIETARVNHGVDNRVTGIVMDTKSGAILAMATTGAFDPNDPFTLDSVSKEKLDNSGFAVGSEEYKKYKTELMQIMWSNKAVSETYEPGSTFKIVTVSAALDKGSVHLTDSFSCPGYREVGGWRIRCHKTTGHGSGFSLAYGLQMSCNPCMIAISERLGSESFYNYVKAFGYLDKTGIDLPSEAESIFHSPEKIGPTELATASFGQRFKVSIINQLTAVATVANGGIPVTPYVVERIVDSEGNTVFAHEQEKKDPVISREVAKEVSEILIAGVDGNGGAKNAGVEGYSIAAKTGTSQKFDVLDSNGNSYLRIGSTVAYSTDEDGGVAVIIVSDEPTGYVKYGSVVAAPYVSMLMEKILPYLEFHSSKESYNIHVNDYVGLSVETAKNLIAKDKISYEIIGDGNKIVSQIPSAGCEFTYPISKIILYTEKENERLVEVPNLVGKKLSDAIIIAAGCGLNIKILGKVSSGLSYDYVSYQSLEYGKKVERGSVIALRVITTDHED